jgi:hypothetical protein
VVARCPLKDHATPGEIPPTDTAPRGEVRSKETPRTIKLFANRAINKAVDTPNPRVISSQSGLIDHELWLSANWQRFQVKGAAHG